MNVIFSKELTDSLRHRRKAIIYCTQTACQVDCSSSSRSDLEQAIIMHDVLVGIINKMSVLYGDPQVLRFPS